MLYISWWLFWFSSNRNPWLSSLNAGRLSFAEHLDWRFSEFWPLTFNHCLAPSKVWTLTFDSAGLFLFLLLFRFLKRSPSTAGPKYPDPHGHWVCYRDYLKCSVPMWSVGVICYEWTGVFRCVCVCVCVWSLGVKKTQFLCLQVFRSVMCSFRQRVEQLVSHAYKEFILISGVYLVFSCSQNVICLW